jgi:HSP20 family molecular chaperone IbpA
MPVLALVEPQLHHGHVKRAETSRILSAFDFQPEPGFTMADRPSSPTPEEREKLDKEAKARENEEQSKLPYKWTQQIGDLDITTTIPGNMKGKDLDVKITKTSIKAGIKGKEAIIEV